MGTIRVTAAAIVIGVSTGSAWSKLPPPSDAATAQAEQTKAKAAWSDKVSLYKTCLAQDRAVEQYRKNLKAAGKETPTPTATPPCTDPGPYVAAATPAASKPLEASEAHSPAGTATAPPSANVPAAEMPKGAQ